MLIVDDNRTNRRILEGILTHWGMVPVVAGDGEQALALYQAATEQSQPFNLILTDMHMPKMDGFGLVERLKGKSAPCNSTIMMLTSGGQRGDAQRCHALGIAAYLLKPVRQSELREAMIRVLSSRQSKESTPMITRSSLREGAVGRKTLKILLAEDNLVNQKLASRLLEKRNHSVTVVLNGREALAALEKNHFDLVLMDMQMPEMDGFEATTILREREKSTGRHQPVIAMTALAMNGDRERCMAVGMDGYLSKPIRPQELDEVLDSFLAPKEDLSTEKDTVPAANGSVDVIQLLDRLDDDRSLLAELLEIFRREYPDLVQAAQRSIDVQRPADLERAGHTLKGALGNLSATKASALAGEFGKDRALHRFNRGANRARSACSRTRQCDSLSGVALPGGCAMKILVADDDSVSRHLMQRTLQKFGYEVVLAENGRVAAEILSRSDGPRLALIDWMMPELDGPELCREVRRFHQEGKYIYIVLLTSKQSSEDIVAGLEAGADDYITKPCQPAELRARLHTGCRILSLEEKLVQAREEMRYKATHDALTAIWNRASILSLMHSELERSVRENKSTSVLLCDIDHFKQVNDNHGHLVGDVVLQEVANRLKSIVRSYDAVGRYGGEEFLIVLSHCDDSILEARAEDDSRSDCGDAHCGGCRGAVYLGQRGRRHLPEMEPGAPDRAHIGPGRCRSLPRQV